MMLDFLMRVLLDCTFYLNSVNLLLKVKFLRWILQVVKVDLVFSTWLLMASMSVTLDSSTWLDSFCKLAVSIINKYFNSLLHLAK